MNKWKDGAVCNVYGNHGNGRRFESFYHNFYFFNFLNSSSSPVYYTTGFSTRVLTRSDLHFYTIKFNDFYGFFLSELKGIKKHILILRIHKPITD